MSLTRCCARCRTIISDCAHKACKCCATQACRCHAADTDAEVIGLLDYLKSKG